MKIRRTSLVVVSLVMVLGWVRISYADFAEDFENYTTQVQMETKWQQLGTSKAQLMTDGAYNNVPTAGTNYQAASGTNDFKSVYRFAPDFGRYSVWFYDNDDYQSIFQVVLTTGGNSDTGIGVGYVYWWNADSYVVYCDPTYYQVATAARSKGWHHVEWELTDPGCKVYFDGNLAATITPDMLNGSSWQQFSNGADGFKFANYWSGQSSLGYYIDGFTHVSPADEDFENYSTQIQMEAKWQQLGTSKAQLMTDGAYNKVPTTGSNYLAAPGTNDFKSVYTFSPDFGRYSVWFYDNDDYLSIFQMVLTAGGNSDTGIGVGYVYWWDMNHYVVYCDPTYYQVTAAARSKGWHHVEWELTDPGCKVYFDGNLAATITPDMLNGSSWQQFSNGADGFKFTNHWSGESSLGYYIDGFTHVSVPVPASTWTLGMPIITYFTGPPMIDANAQQMVEGGWNLVWAWSPAELDVAQAHGLRAMWAGSLDSTTVKSIRNHPALYAYYITDEPSAAKFSELASTMSHLRVLDPNHMAYINLFPTYASSTQLGTSDYPTYLSQYMSIVKPSLLSYDNYQFLTRGDKSDYFMNLAIISRTAKQAGIPFLNIVQACSYDSGMRVPNGNQLRYLYYTSLAYGAQGISDFVYSVLPGGMASEDGTPRELYYTAKTINPEFVAITQQVQSMDHIGAYHLGDLPPGFGTTDGSSPMRLPGDSPFTLSPGIPNTNYVNWQPVRGAVLGFWGPNDLLSGATHTLVVNLNYSNALSTRVIGPGNLSVFDPATGMWIAQGHAYADVSLLPGGGVLVGLTSAVTPALSVTPGSQLVGAPTGTTTFNVSNAGTGMMPWSAQVIDGGSWLSISSGGSGTNSGTINVAFTANSGWTATRTGTIRITASGTLGSPIDVTVVQTKDRLPGDANEDNAVDVGDLGILAANYGGTGKSWGQGDFNNDGAVDVGDLGILAAHYGTNASSADWATDYAQAFGTTVDADTSDTGSSACSDLGLPLIAGLALMGLMLVKLEE
jgi:hypothetical protein